MSVFAGRWDLVVGEGSTAYPSWLEVSSDLTSGRFVGKVGSARPVPTVTVDGDEIEWSLPKQYEGNLETLTFRGRLEGDVLRGTTIGEEGTELPWVGKRQDPLTRTGAPAFGEPIELFNGKDLTGWGPKSADLPYKWRVLDGLLDNEAVGSDIVTDAAYGDFRLVAEYRYPEGSNSGIYLRGRYEMQILDDHGTDPHVGGSGAIYGFLQPRVNAIHPHGEWQTADITLYGRRLTLVLNGETIHEDAEIPGITGGALDSDEGNPGRIFLQGDHGPVTFRRLTLYPILS